MRRTTIYLDPDLELLLEREARRRRQPMAALIREAVRSHFGASRPPEPPGAGAFESGRTDTAERSDEALRDTGFGESR